MQHATKPLIIATLTFVVGICVWGAYYFYDSTRGKIFDNWETANAEFKIRISAYKEMAAFTPGAYYVFQSAKVGSDNWSEFMTLRTDGLIPIPREQVRFVNDHTGYAFMGATYAVTTDGGRTWTCWNADSELKESVRVDSRSIKKVDISADGTGVMHLYDNPFQQGQVPILRTHNYGRHWSLE